MPNVPGLSRVCFIPELGGVTQLVLLLAQRVTCRSAARRKVGRPLMPSSRSKLGSPLPEGFRAKQALVASTKGFFRGNLPKAAY
jgi:hypothetical protein